MLLLSFQTVNDADDYNARVLFAAVNCMFCWSFLLIANTKWKENTFLVFVFFSFVFFFLCVCVWVFSQIFHSSSWVLQLNVENSVQNNNDFKKNLQFFLKYVSFFLFLANVTERFQALKFYSIVPRDHIFLTVKEALEYTKKKRLVFQ